MLRSLRVAAGLVLVSAMATQPARAQWSYGGWGWGGWGQTPEGAYLDGLGQFAVGAGIYNYETALANQINAQTFMQLNDYMAQVAHEAAFMHHARVHQEFLRVKTLYDKHIQSLRDTPTPQQIENGDALNQAVRDLSDPRLGSSALRAANAPIEAQMIAEVPFANTDERVTIRLDQLRKALTWPEVLEEERFQNDRKLFDDIITRMRKEDQEGEIQPETRQQARALVDDLRAKIAAQPLKDEDDQREATRFLNAGSALIGLLNQREARQALAQLRQVKDTTIGGLLSFMRASNLRFAPATKLREKQIYHQLYEALDQTRDRTLSEAQLDLKPRSQANPAVSTDFYGRIRPQPETAPPSQ